MKSNALRNKILLSLVFMTVVIGIGLLAYGALSQKEKEDAKSPLKVLRKVRAKEVTYKDTTATVTGLGKVLSSNIVSLVSEVQGEILPVKVPLKIGQTFKKGDTLVKIFDRDALYLLQAKKSDFLRTVSNILPDLKIDYPDSYNAWYAFFIQISVDKPLPPLPKEKSHKERIYISNNNVYNAYYQIKSDEIVYDKYNIVAPFNGVYRDVIAEVGGVATPSTRLASILRTDNLEIELPVSVKDIQWVHKDAEVDIHYENKIVKGKIIRIAQYVDENVQSVNVYVKVNKTQYQIIPGMFLQIDIYGDIIKDIEELPRKAIFDTNQAFVVEQGKLKQREIEIVKTNNKTCLITGLFEGDSVVVEAMLGGAEGDEVKILN